MLHLVIHIDHVSLSLVNVVFEVVQLLVLERQLSFLVLRLIFGMLDDFCDIFNLFVLVTYFLLLKLKDPLIFEITSLIKLTVLTSHESFCLHVLILLVIIILNCLVLLEQLIFRDFLEFLDFTQSLLYVPLAQIWMPAWLVFVFIDQFVEVHTGRVQGVVSCLHQVFLR